MKVITHPQIVTQTKEGEININLNITLTINQDGVLVTTEADSKKTTKLPEKEIPDSLFAIPDFQSEKVLDDFGIDTSR